MTQQVLHRMGFRWSEIFLYAAIGLGPLSFVCSSSAQAAPARSVIEASQVVAAMRDGSLPIEGAKVKISAPVTSSIVMAKLEVLSATVIGSHDVRLRMACLDRTTQTQSMKTSFVAGSCHNRQTRRHLRNPLRRRVTRACPSRRMRRRKRHCCTPERRRHWSVMRTRYTFGLR